MINDIIKVLFGSKEKKDNLKSDELFENNYEDILKANAKVLTRVLYIVIPILIGLFGISFIIPSFRGLHIAYMVLLIVAVSILILSINIEIGKIHTICLYIYFLGVFFLAVYLSIFKYNNSPGVTIVGVFCFLPVVIIDKSRNINFCTIICYFLYGALALLFKPISLAIDDMIIIACFMSTSIYVGGQVRRIQIENFELKRQSTIREYTDFLTNLSNRRKMFEKISESENEDCKRKITGIIMIDIDKFKQFNDTYGHQKGDECLSKIGKCFKEFGRENEIEFFRYGGEEFIGLSYTRIDGMLYKSVCKLSKAVFDLNISYDESPYRRVTISIGISEVINHNFNGYEQLISFADEALYYAKDNGRNKIVSHSELMCDF